MNSQSPLRRSFKRSGTLQLPSSYLENPRKESKEVASSRYEHLKQVTSAALDSYSNTVIMTLVTLYTLIGDDLRNAAFSKESDDIFFGLAACCLFLFTAELLFSFWSKPEYKWGFYFSLDAIATVSLIPDIGWIWYPLVDIDDEGNYSDSEQIQNAGKASRVGTRASRLIRIIRLIRLIRIAKLYKNAKQALKEELEEDDPGTQLVAESRVGKKLTDLTTKRVIILVLVMLLIVPFFESEFFTRTQTSWDYGLNTVVGFIGQAGFEDIYGEYLDYHQDKTSPIIYLSYKDAVGQTVTWAQEDLDGFRFNEKHYSYDLEDIAVAVFDLRQETKLAALLSICKTLFVCVILVTGALCFFNDASQLVIQPIEQMMLNVKKMAKNPIAKLEIDVYTHEEERVCCGLLRAKKREEAEYETLLIENTINKIGALLALGFGEAGASIIGTNISKGGDIDPMLEGSKILGIFGFCDIRNFTDVTEELLEGVMLFVNEIAHIVHSTVSKHQGAANKNIGDAFLLVWKFDRSDYRIEGDKVTLNPESRKAGYLADLALLAFIKVIAKLNRDPAILKYNCNEKLCRRMPGYTVKMGFGLHSGWGIEGAIGSEFKIDASYLSPHVNIASRLEVATKQYGVPLLLSGKFVDGLSAKVSEYLRHIDTVTLKGSNHPMRLYTIDLDVQSLSVSKHKCKAKQINEIDRRSTKLRLERKEIASWDLYSQSKSFQLMCKSFSHELHSVWDSFMQLYTRGQWADCKPLLQSYLALQPDDGPALSLSHYLSNASFTAPDDWAGYRVLSDK